MTSATSGRRVAHDHDPAAYHSDEGRVAAPPALSSAALEQLYRCEQPRLARTLRRRLRDPEDIADLLQDAFERLARARPGAAIKMPAAYLGRVVRNLVVDRLKRAEYRVLVRGGSLNEADLAVTPPEQSLQIEARELMNAYCTALDALAPRSREVFLLHRVDELRYREIAERLGITVATVEYHMARALAHLDRALHE